MVLVYDIRRDKSCQEKILSGLKQQWEAYLRGERPASIAEGRIAKLFYAPYEGEHMFLLDEGTRTSSWIRHGEDSWYAVGRRARVEQVIFDAPDPVGRIPLVTRLWISDAVEEPR